MRGAVVSLVVPALPEDWHEDWHGGSVPRSAPFGAAGEAAGAGEEVHPLQATCLPSRLPSCRGLRLARPRCRPLPSPSSHRSAWPLPGGGLSSHSQGEGALLWTSRAPAAPARRRSAGAQTCDWGLPTACAPRTDAVRVGCVGNPFSGVSRAGFVPTYRPGPGHPGRINPAHPSLWARSEGQGTSWPALQAPRLTPLIGSRRAPLARAEL